MTESYDGPYIDEYVTMNPGGILPDEAYDTPQGTAANLRDGEWTALASGTAYRDSRSGLTLVDAFDSSLDAVSERQLAISPFIMAVHSIDGLRRYILDMRRLRNLRLPVINLAIDPTLNDDPFASETMQLRQHNHGTHIVSSFLLRNYNETRAYVEKDLEVTAAIFAQEVDDFLAANKDAFAAGKQVSLPVASQTRSDMEFHRDIGEDVAELKRGLVETDGS